VGGAREARVSDLDQVGDGNSGGIDNKSLANFGLIQGLRRKSGVVERGLGGLRSLESLQEQMR